MEKKFFETIKIIDGKPQNLAYHQARVDRTIKENFFHESFDLKRHINFNRDGLYKCKLIYSDMFEELTFDPYTPKIIKTIKLVDANIDYSYKYFDRENINKLKPEGIDEIIIIKNGLITDTTIANISLKIDDIWYTPQTPILQGTQREKLLYEGKIQPKKLSIDALHEASQIGFMNAMIGWVIYDKTKLSISSV